MIYSKRTLEAVREFFDKLLQEAEDEEKKLHANPVFRVPDPGDEVGDQSWRSSRVRSCRGCKRVRMTTDRFCPSCGTALELAAVCEGGCADSFPDFGDKFCGICGRPLTVPVQKALVPADLSDPNDIGEVADGA